MNKYDEKAPSRFVVYLDCNNLYGHSMSQSLPYSGFRWMTDKEIGKIDLGKYKPDGKKGLIPEGRSRISSRIARSQGARDCNYGIPRLNQNKMKRLYELNITECQGNIKTIKLSISFKP